MTNPFRELYLAELTKKQKKIDADKDGKIEGSDLAALRAKKPVEEEIEKIDELSKDTLHSYLDKAKRNRNTQSKTMSRAYMNDADKYDSAEHKRDQRNKGIATAKRKTNEDVDNAKPVGKGGKVETKKYSWGTMKTVHHGADFSIPLHPEHHQAIAKLKDQQEHKFKDETGRHWTAKKSGEHVHFQGANGGGKTHVPAHTMSEETEHVDEAVRVYDVSKSNSGTRPKTPEERNKAAAEVKAARANKPKDNYSGKAVTGAGSAGAGARQAGKKANYIGVKESLLSRVAQLAEAMKKCKECGKKHEGACSYSEELTGGQKNLDKNNNNKLDSQDFKLLRKKKKMSEEVDEGYQSYSGRSHGHAYGGGGFGRREREDDEYHVPDPVSSRPRAPVAPVPPKKKEQMKPRVGHPTNEEVEHIDEANHREFAAQGKMHPSMAKHMTVGQHMDYYEPKTGDKVHGKVMHNSGKEVHVKQTHDSYNPKKVGSVHKFTVSDKLDEEIVSEEQGYTLQSKHTNADGTTTVTLKSPDGKIKKHTGKDVHKVVKKMYGVQSEEVVQEKINMDKASMGDVIKDFKKSDAPQFAGKSAEKRRQMAIAAKLSAQRNEEEEMTLSFKDYLNEVKMSDLPVRKVSGSYGTEYYKKEREKDEKGYDSEDNEGPSHETKEKRGRGRPKGASSGARQKGSTTGKKRSGVEMTGYPLHLPNR